MTSMQQTPTSAYLIIRQDGRWSDVFRLQKDQPLVIGRSSSNAIIVTDDRSSRRHAEVFFQDGAWKVKDLGSRNGTMVDGQHITGEHTLLSGQTIQVASCRVSFVDALTDGFSNLSVLPDPQMPSPLSDDRLDLLQNANSTTNSQLESPRQSRNHSDPIIAIAPNNAGSSEHPTVTASTSKNPITTNKTDQHTANQQTISIDQTPIITHRVEPQPWSTELAFEIARQTTWENACDAALDKILKLTGIQAGGILRVEDANLTTLTDSELKSPDDSHLKSRKRFSNGPIRLGVLAARERSGKAYHRVSESIARAVLVQGQSVLARNIQNDPTVGDIQTSQVRSTSSLLCAPILVGHEAIALLHLYSREDEPMLAQEALPKAITICQLLAVAYQQIGKQLHLRKKLAVKESQLNHLRTQLEDQHRDNAMIGNSAAIVRLKSQLRRVAQSNATVLLRGESGVGKELAAREVHNHSQRADGPFVALNCGALSPTLLESELFGHEKGSFTGATERKAGKFELADGGTLLLDEVGEMTPEIQVKFLRVLEGQTFDRVGGGKPIRVNVRVIAATNRDLEHAVQAGVFRADLYFRLRVVEISLPSLRDRRDDILPLAEHFLNIFRKNSASGPTGFSERAKKAMLDYAWPGNIRELRNCVERAYVLSNEPLAEPEDLALSYLIVPSNKSARLSNADEHASSEQVTALDIPYLEKSLEDVEKDHIFATLKYTGGQKSRAATILGIERSTLDRKLKKFEGD